MEIKKEFWKFILNYEKYIPYTYLENGEYYIGLHHKITDKEKQYIELYPSRSMPPNYLIWLTDAMANGTLNELEKESKFMPMSMVFKIFKADLMKCLREAISYFDADGVTLSDTQANALMSYLFSGGTLKNCPQQLSRVGDFIYKSGENRRYYEKLLFEGKFLPSKAINLKRYFDNNSLPTNDGLVYGDYFIASAPATFQGLIYEKGDKAIWDGSKFLFESSNYNAGSFPSPVGEPNRALYGMYGNSSNSNVKTEDIDTNLPGADIMTYEESIANGKDEGDINIFFKSDVVSKYKKNKYKFPKLDLKLIEMVNVPITVPVPSPVSKGINVNVPVPIPVCTLAKLFTFDNLLKWLKGGTKSIPIWYQEETCYYVSPLAGTPTLKSSDSYGDAWFKASRDNGVKAHSGIDMKPTKGNDVKAPVDGVIVNVVYCKKDNPKFYYVWIKPDKFPNYYIGLKYVTLNSGLGAGSRIKQGNVIGNLTDLSPEYPNVAKHLHLEVTQGGYGADAKRLNPMKLIFGDRQKITTQTDNWTAGKYYNVGDVCYYPVDSATEVTCIVEHQAEYQSSSAPNVMNENNKTYWNPQPEETLQEFIPNKLYKVGDRITDDITDENAIIRVCIEEHVGQSSLELEKGVNWKMWTPEYERQWTPNTTYVVGNTIKDGITRTCIYTHVSSDSITKDAVYWFPSPTTNSWHASTYYDIGVVVEYNNTMYKCIKKHTSGSVFGTNANDASDTIDTLWHDTLLPANWKPSTGSEPTAYAVDDLVVYEGARYICVIANHNETTFKDSQWSLVDL